MKKTIVKSTAEVAMSRIEKSWTKNRKPYLSRDQKRSEKISIKLNPLEAASLLKIQSKMKLPTVSATIRELINQAGRTQKAESLVKQAKSVLRKSLK